MFYCQHLVGIGHLVRSVAIVRALAADFSVMFVAGGPPVADVEFPREADVVRLPAIQSDTEFERLQVCDPLMSLEETSALRTDLLLRVFDSFAPDVLITELYPVGRKKFDFELIPLLERAIARDDKPVTVSSIRDVLVVKKDQAKHGRRVCEIINRFNDLVLVHGDERLHQLEETFPRVDDLACRVEYTGYVVPERTRASDDGTDETLHRRKIVVSVGNGRYPQGHALVQAALRAATHLESRIPHEFHIFAGPLVPGEVYAGMEALAAPARNVRLRRNTPDLAFQMKHAALSVSLGGYNTVMDILSARVPALVWPVTSNGDGEQSIRAAALERLGVVKVLRPDDQHPETLAGSITRALEMKPTRLGLNLDGARNTARILMEFLSRLEQDRVGTGIEPSVS
jgi:predicted glycosyltransferase